MKREHIGHFGEDSQLGQWDDDQIGQTMPGGFTPPGGAGAGTDPSAGAGARAGTGTGRTDPRYALTAEHAGYTGPRMSLPTSTQIVAVDPKAIAERRRQQRIRAGAAPAIVNGKMDPYSTSYRPPPISPALPPPGATPADTVYTPHEGSEDLPLSTGEKSGLKRVHAITKHTTIVPKGPPTGPEQALKELYWENQEVIVYGTAALFAFATVYYFIGGR